MPRVADEPAVDVESTVDETVERATVEFHGVQYPIADEIGLMPQMRFAKLAQRQDRDPSSVSEQDSLVAMYDLLEQCLDPAAWPAFEAAAIEYRTSGDDLMKVVQQAFLANTGRPTRRRSDSSPGPSNTEPSSTSSPAARAIGHLAGRPDLQLVVMRAQEAAAQAS